MISSPQGLPNVRQDFANENASTVPKEHRNPVVTAFAENVNSSILVSVVSEVELIAWPPLAQVLNA